MITQALSQIGPSSQVSAVESYLSFAGFIAYLEKKVTAGANKASYFPYLLQKFRSFPHLPEAISLDEVSQYEELLEAIVSVVMPFEEEGDARLVGLGNAFSTDILYGTPAFQHLMAVSSQEENRVLISPGDLSQQVCKEHFYNFILSKLYQLPAPFQEDWVHSFLNPATGLLKYYRLQVDSRFVDVRAKKELQDITPALLKTSLACSPGQSPLEELLPLDAFVASGFTIITATEVTVQQAIEQIGKVVLQVNAENAHASFEKIRQLLQTLVGSRDYQFGMLPFFTVNNRAAILYENFTFSLLLNTCWQAGVPKKEIAAFIDAYLRQPSPIVFRAAQQENEALPEAIQAAFRKAGLYYYSLVPAHYGSRLVGVCEIACTREDLEPEAAQIKNIRGAFPYIAQLIQLFVENFNIIIETIVKEHFTNIRPSVQWKFNEVAWHYFRNNEVEKKNIPLEKVAFEKVYPLYGAIDIRNSTKERNVAQREDLHTQLTHLSSLFTLLSQHHQHSEQAAALRNSCQHWIQQLTHVISIEERELESFFQKEAHPFLKAMAGVPEEINRQLVQYWSNLDYQSGQYMQKRNRVEHSMQLINDALGTYFRLFNEELQTSYPCYFEAFRTDGIEYDIYIGQSIAPRQPFSSEHLQKVRLWQLQSMAALTKVTHSLLAMMPHPLYTTQLLYVNDRTIDITFRNDERRFDVEGSYNIRYQVIKKRIDKVHILHTNERLTQPQKIAIVYFEEQNAAEYVRYIKQLQEEHILLSDLEFLELEELQGVSGLKALRVGVNLE